MGAASVITKDHSQALADNGQRQFDILPREREHCNYLAMKSVK